MTLMYVDVMSQNTQCVHMSSHVRPKLTSFQQVVLTNVNVTFGERSLRRFSDRLVGAICVKQIWTWCKTGRSNV